jgi:hypothetical protein
MFYASGGYDRIAEHVFRRAKFDRFLLEYDDARSGTFEPLKFVPDDRTVVLGLVSSKTPRMESSEDLKARIAEAAKIVPLDRLALSPQCGFASTHEETRHHPPLNSNGSSSWLPPSRTRSGRNEQGARSQGVRSYRIVLETAVATEQARGSER